MLDRGDSVDLTGQTILAFLEEDDERRVLFRVRPVLCAQGVINPEDLSEYGGEGFLRVAPDRAEQHSFKERMRSLGKLCVISLQGTPGAPFKVRPNKNYAPSRGESNRYIVYSDAVQAVPPGLLYEVVPEERCTAALTRQYYLRAGGRISGPHCPDGSLACPASQTLMPDCERLFYVELPDGTSSMFYWPMDAAAPEGATLEAAQHATPSDAPVDMEPAQAKVSGLTEQAAPADEAVQAFSGVPDGAVLASAAETLQRVLGAAGFWVDAPDAHCLALLMAVSPRLQVAGDTPADSAYAARVLTTVLASGEGGPAVRVLGRDRRGQPGRQQGRYLARPWPVFRLRSAPRIPGDIPAGAIDPSALKRLAAQARQGADEALFARLNALIAYAEAHQQALALPLRGMMADALALGQYLPQDVQGDLFECLAAAILIPYEQANGLGESVSAAFLAQ